MKTLILTAILLVGFTSYSQRKYDVFVDTREQINIASNETVKQFVPRPATLKSNTEAVAKFNVTFINFPEQAKNAFLEAIAIYENLISSNVPVKIQASMEPITGQVLGKGKPGSFHKNFNGALVSDVYYPVALAEKLSGKNINGDEPDIIITFNSNTIWYFGADGNTPTAQYDFLSATLHEITHGLGFSGFLDVTNNQGFFVNPTNTPSIYDYNIMNEIGQQIADPKIFDRPSCELYTQLTSDKLKIEDPVFNNLNASKVYAPATWANGSSIYHTKETLLMYPFLFKGKAIHNPGENVLKVLADLGWKTVAIENGQISDIEIPCASVPVNFKFNSDFELDNSSIKVVFSTNSFNSSDSLSLFYNNESGTFDGQIPTNNKTGKFQYFIEVKTSENKIYRFPSLAPKNIMSFKIGPDYYPPVILHKPINEIDNINSKISIAAFAEDNIGINEVRVEYKINGIEQEPVILEQDVLNHFIGTIDPGMTKSNVYNIEYRIVAEDNSTRRNKKYEPQTGYHTVEIQNLNVTATNYIYALINMQIYPNPCVDYLKINLAGADYMSQVEISIYSITGKSIYHEVWDDMNLNHEKQIDLAAFKPGIYLVKATDGKTKNYSEKFIKN